LAHSCLVGVM